MKQKDFNFLVSCGEYEARRLKDAEAAIESADKAVQRAEEQLAVARQHKPHLEAKRDRAKADYDAAIAAIRAAQAEGIEPDEPFKTVATGVGAAHDISFTVTPGSN